MLIKFLRYTIPGYIFTLALAVSAATYPPPQSDEWSIPATISFPTGVTENVHDFDIAVDAAGTFYVVFVCSDTTSQRLGLFITQSSDGGNTWSIPQPLYPDWATRTDRGGTGITLDAGDNGTLLVGWEHETTGPDGQPVVAISQDSGLTWSDPVTITNDPSPGPIFTVGYCGSGNWIYVTSSTTGTTTYTLSLDNGVSWGESRAVSVGPVHDIIHAPGSDETALVAGKVLFSHDNGQSFDTEMPGTRAATDGFGNWVSALGGLTFLRTWESADRGTTSVAGLNTSPYYGMVQNVDDLATDRYGNTVVLAYDMYMQWNPQSQTYTFLYPKIVSRRSPAETWIPWVAPPVAEQLISDGSGRFLLISKFPGNKLTYSTLNLIPPAGASAWSLYE